MPWGKPVTFNPFGVEEDLPPAPADYDPFQAFTPNDIAARGEVFPDARKKGPGILGQSFGMLSPEESKADLDSRFADLDRGQKQVLNLEKMLGATTNPYQRRAVEAQLRNARAGLPDVDQLQLMEAGNRPLATKTGIRSGVENAATGFAESVLGVPEFVGIMKGYIGPGKVDDDSLLKWSLGAKDYVRGLFPGDAARQTDFSQQFASGLGQIASFYGAGALAALAKAGPKATAAVVASLGATATGSSGFEEGTRELTAARAKAAASGDTASVTEFDRLLKTLGYTAIGTTEAIPVARTFSRAVPNPVTGLEHRLVQTAEGALEEALQESGSQLAQNVVTQQTTDPNRSTTEGVTDSGAVGGALGGFMNFLLPGRFRPQARGAGVTPETPGTGLVPSGQPFEDRGQLRSAPDGPAPDARLGLGVSTTRMGNPAQAAPAAPSMGMSTSSVGEPAQDGAADPARQALRTEVERQINANPKLRGKAPILLDLFDSQTYPDAQAVVGRATTAAAETGRVSAAAHALIGALDSQITTQDAYGTTQDRVNLLNRPTATATPPSPSIQSAPVGSFSTGDVLSALGAREAPARDVDQLGYYSKALEEAKALKQAKGTPEQMLSMLKKAGVKDSEIAATGLMKFLEGKPSVTRDEIVAHLSDNRTQLQESVYGGVSPKISALRERRDSLEQRVRNEAGMHSDADFRALVDERTRVQTELDDALESRRASGYKKPKWKDYSLDPDNPTYRETVLHLGDNQDAWRAYTDWAAKMGAKYAANWENQLDADERAQMDALTERVNEEKKRAAGNWTSGHWEEPNIVAHMRTGEYQDTKGRKVTLLDELQSDEGQKIREVGVADPDKHAERVAGVEAQNAVVLARVAALEARLEAMMAEDKTPLARAYNIARAYDAENDTDYAKRALSTERLMSGSDIQSDYYGFEKDIRSQILEQDPEYMRRAAEHERVYNEWKAGDPRGTPAYEAGYQRALRAEAAQAKRWDELVSNDPANLLLAEIETERHRFTIPGQDPGRKGHPLVNTTDQWVETAMRRLIQQAVDQGAEGIAITPGKVQNERFGIGGVINNADVWHDVANGRLYRRVVLNNVARAFATIVVDDTGVVTQADGQLGQAIGQPLSAVIGQRGADAIMNAGDRQTLGLDELEVGGDGMRATYDNIYPRALGKLLQKLDKDIKPEKVNLRLSEYALHGKFNDPINFTFFPLTEKAKAKLAEEGQPLFALAPKGDTNGRHQPDGDGKRRSASGSLAPLKGAPVVDGATGPDPRVVAAAEQYARDNGIDLKRQAVFAKVDEALATRIAGAYEAMQHAPSDPAVRAAYDDMIAQTIAQYRAIEAAGYEFFFYDEQTDPYEGNPWNSIRDLRQNQRMGVFATEAGFGSGVTDLNTDDSPMLADTGIEWPYGSLDGPKKRVLANDLFRAVHDIFGHSMEGAGFRARGEENAWQAHIRLYTGPAVGAVTSETRGQNSWLNFGPYGEKNQTASVEDTVFADQKIGLMPEFTWQEGRAPDEVGDSDIIAAVKLGAQSLQGWQASLAEHHQGQDWPGPAAAADAISTMVATDSRSPSAMQKALSAEGFGTLPRPLLDQGLLTANLMSVGRPPATEILAALKGFYSPAIRSAEKIKQDKATPEQWWQMISKTPGVRAEELAWMGLKQWLDNEQAYDRKSLRKSDILDFMRSHELETEEVLLEGGENAQEEIEERADELYREWEAKDVAEDLRTWASEYEPDFEIAVKQNNDPAAKAKAVAKYEAALLDLEQRDLFAPHAPKPELTDFWEDDPDAELWYFELINNGNSHDGEDYHSRDDDDELFDTAEEAREAAQTMLDQREKEFEAEKEEKSDELWREREDYRNDAMYHEFVGEATQELGGVSTVKYAEYKIEGGEDEDYRELLIKLPLLENAGYKSAHFKTNEVVHIRFDERQSDHGKTLFIHEIQSDLHQRARKKGYRSPDGEKLYREAEGAFEEALETYQGEVRRKLETGEPIVVSYGRESGYPDGRTVSFWMENGRNKGFRVVSQITDATLDYQPPVEDQTDYYDSPSEASKAALNIFGNPSLAHRIDPGLKAAQDRMAMAKEALSSPYPDAPYKGDAWWQLAFKAALQYAVENGYDAIALTTPQQITDASGTPEHVAEKFYGENLPRFINKYVKQWGSKEAPVPLSGAPGASGAWEYTGEIDQNDVPSVVGWIDRVIAATSNGSQWSAERLGELRSILAEPGMTPDRMYTHLRDHMTFQHHAQHGARGVPPLKKFVRSGEPNLAWPITQKMKQDINDVGQPMAAGARDATKKALTGMLKLGRTVNIPDSVAETVFGAIAPAREVLPPNTDAYVLKKIVPTENKGRVVAHFVSQNGTPYELEGTIDDLFIQRAFFYKSPIGVTEGVFFVPLAFSGKLDELFRGELRHEAIHAARRDDRLTGPVWDTLVSHAKQLRVMSNKLSSYLEAIGADSNVSTDEVLGDAYHQQYKNRTDYDEVMDQEAVAHMAELYSHGVLTPQQIAPVQHIMDAFFAGEFSKGTPEDAANFEPELIQRAVPADILDLLKEESREFAKLFFGTPDPAQGGKVRHGPEQKAPGRIAQADEITPSGEDFARSSRVGRALDRRPIEGKLQRRALEEFLGDYWKRKAALKRARLQGFTTKAWHSTTSDFLIPDPARQGYDFGFHMAVNSPEAANARADLSDAEIQLHQIAGEPLGPRQLNAHNLPLLVKAQKPFRWWDEGAWLGEQMWRVGAARLLMAPPTAATKHPDHDGLFYPENSAFKHVKEPPRELIQQIYNLAVDSQEGDPRLSRFFMENLTDLLEAHGYDSIVYNNLYEDEGNDSLMVWNPSNVRSMYDAFDPRAEGKPGLFASVPYLEADLRKELNGILRSQGLDEISPLFALRPVNKDGKPIQDDLDFARWFKDSKVVDADGNPLIVYHGTGAAIKSFYGMVWGATTPGLANEYAAMRGMRGGKENVVPLYMRVENPFDADTLPKSVTIGQFLNEILEQAHKQGNPLSQKTRLSELFDIVRAASKREESGPHYGRHDFWFEPQAMFGKDGADAIKEVFRIAGFDGVKMLEGGALTYGAFKPEQVKSVFNRGTFDSEDADILSAFAGSGAVTSDWEQMARAQAMEDEGKGSWEIWEETGWTRGLEGDWKFEIDDSGSEWGWRDPFGTIRTKARDQVPVQLHEVLVHPKLYDAYPHLRKIKVLFSNNMPFESGGFDTSNDTIHLGIAPFQNTVTGQHFPGLTDQAVDLDKLRSTLLHEIQHAIQKTENFAWGANVEGERSNFMGRLTSDELTELDHAVMEHEGLTPLLNRYQNALAFLGAGEGIVSASAPLAATMQDSAMQAASELAQKMGFALYRRSAGEAESRTTQKRRNHPGPMRRAEPPQFDADYPRNQIVVTRHTTVPPAQQYTQYLRKTQARGEKPISFLAFKKQNEAESV